MLKWVKTGENNSSQMMENSIQTIELSMGKLELCPKAVLAIWPYGATKEVLKSTKKKNRGGICAIFSDKNVPQITQSMSESQFPKLTNSIVDIWSVVHGLQTARDNGYQMVEIRTASRLLKEVLTKWLDVWKKNKWKKGNGGRLVIPITLLKRLDSLLMELNVNVVHIARGSCPEIVLAETLAKQSCNQAEQLSADQNFNFVPPVNSEIAGSHHQKPIQKSNICLDAENGPTEATKINKQMQQKIVLTLKKRQKEKNRRKLKRMKFGTMKKKINL